MAARQNPDGGWSYGTGNSWTEPTCYALMALAAEGLDASAAARRGGEWLAARQRSDGGWTPRDSVRESTWVTALALLVPAGLVRGIDRQRALTWMLDQTGRESGFVQRLRRRLLGVPEDNSLAYDGWPWYPGAAAWVMPTALSILAMERAGREFGMPRVQRRIEEGRAFLLVRRCRDGGWNHGSTHALGYDSDSYPETTGMAVLALHGSRDPSMKIGIAAAERHLASSKSLEATGWLTLALTAAGRKPERPTFEIGPEAGTMALAVATLASAALEGRHFLTAS